jgi:hypothetical protein
MTKIDWMKPLEVFDPEYGAHALGELQPNPDNEFWPHVAYCVTMGKTFYVNKRDGTINDGMSGGDWVIRNRGDGKFVAAMTEADARMRFLSRHIGETNQDAFVRSLRDLGLIREETLAERFSRETGVAVTDDNREAVERALAEAAERIAGLETALRQAAGDFHLIALHDNKAAMWADAKAGRERALGVL